MRTSESLPLLLLALVSLVVWGCGGDESTRPSDTSAPARVEDLSVAQPAIGLLELSWTAPGDDGSEGRAATYDLRYRRESLTEETWDEATSVTDLPEPKPAGERERLVLEDFPQGTWAFGLRAADEVPNWSPLSNVVTVVVAPDTVPPGRVEDLAAETVDSTRVRLTWTAPGDDGGVGRAEEYEIAYATDSMTVLEWEEANRIPGLVPGPARGTDSYVVSGLLPGTGYVFALRTRDEAGNWSPISNLASGGTVRPVLRLTRSSRRDGAREADWSPDGQTLAFLADWDVQYENEVYVIPAGGGQATKITDEELWVVSVRWSPDGTRIGYLRGRRDGQDLSYEICAVDPVPGAQASVLWRPQGTEFMHDFCWSPDGSRIAYVVQVTWQPIRQEIRIVDLDQGEAESLVQESGWIWGIDWLPDGTEILYSVRSGDEPSRIWAVPVQGGAPVDITPPGGSAGFPVCSPDGAFVAFSSVREGRRDIWILERATGETRPLRVDPVVVRATAWSPDGRRLAVTLWEDQVYDIGLVDVD
jgi:hypothetical protein